MRSLSLARPSSGRKYRSSSYRGVSLMPSKKSVAFKGPSLERRRSFIAWHTASRAASSVRRKRMSSKKRIALLVPFRRSGDWFYPLAFHLLTVKGEHGCDVGVLRSDGPTNYFGSSVALLSPHSVKQQWHNLSATMPYTLGVLVLFEGVACQ